MNTRVQVVVFTALHSATLAKIDINGDPKMISVASERVRKWYGLEATLIGAKPFLPCVPLRY